VQAEVRSAISCSSVNKTLKFCAAVRLYCSSACRCSYRARILVQWIDDSRRSTATQRCPCPTAHAYISSYSPSSSSGGGGGGFFFSSSRRSSGHVEFNFSQGPMQSRSNLWSLWQGSSTTSGNSSMRPCQARGKRSARHSYLPSRNGFVQIGQTSVGLSVFLGTLSSSSRKLLGTPLSSVGGSSAFCRSISIMLAKRSFSSGPSSAGRPRIVSNAFASRRNAAAMFSGCGSALAFVCACGSDVSTSSSCEKKVDRSGRRGACCGCSSLAEMLCSTASHQRRQVRL
jgi:hypothetical protein